MSIENVSYILLLLEHFHFYIKYPFIGCDKYSFAYFRGSKNKQNSNNVASQYVKKS